jgi:hypothetical protein
VGVTEIDFEKAIQALNPVTWIYNNDPKNIRQLGYIAEEVNEVNSLKYMVVLDKEDKPMALRYDILSVYTVEVLKILMQKIEKLENEINTLKNK